MLKLGLSRKRTDGHGASLRCQWRGKHRAATDAMQTFHRNCHSNRRLSCFGHIARMNSADIHTRHTRCSMVISEASVQDEDQGRDGCVTRQTTARLCTSLYQRPTDLPKTRHCMDKPDVEQWSCSCRIESTSPRIKSSEVILMIGKEFWPYRSKKREMEGKQRTKRRDDGMLGPWRRLTTANLITLTLTLNLPLILILTLIMWSGCEVVTGHRLAFRQMCVLVCQVFVC